jgi:hypothetical protein
MNYLQDQAVMNFAGTAARGSAIGTAVSQGMVSYLNDSNVVQAYDGSAWNSLAYATAVPTLAQTGLRTVIPTSVTVGSGSGSYNSTTGYITFTGATSINVNGCFTSSFTNYKILVYEIGSSLTGTAVKFRLRQSGSDSTGLYYQNGITQASNLSAGAYYLANSAWWDLYPPPPGPNYGNTSIEVFQPNLALRTTGNFVAMGFNTAVGMASGGLMHDSASIYDGFSLVTNSAATFTGKMKVFGYN